MHKPITLPGMAPPPLWEIEWRVVDIACEQLGLDRARVSPDFHLLEDLNLDSLDAVELIMEIEEAFQISLPDDRWQDIFVTRPMTLRTMAEAVVLYWGTGIPDRQCWTKARAPLPPADSAPRTQFDSSCSPRDWLTGPLYELLDDSREGTPQYRRLTDGMRCILLPAAETRIGNPDPGSPTEQRPVHAVSLSSFLIDAEPVSTAAYARFLNSVARGLPDEIVREWCGINSDDRRGRQYPLNRSWRSWKPVKGVDEQPMMLVSWFGANAYSLWANRLDWRAYRGDGLGVPELEHSGVETPPPPESWLHSCLPSEAQWEYAARGPAPCEYPWGDQPPTDALVRVARHQRGVEYTAEDLPAAKVNERLGMSPFGLHHMAGNVWQWCRDWYAPEFYAQPEAIGADPQNSRPTGIRSERGGSWVGPAELAKCSYRRGRPPAMRGRCLGFRCIGLLEDLP